MTYVLAMGSVAVSLYISYNIVMGVLEIEGKYNNPLNGDRLKSTWNLLAIISILTLILSLIPVVAVI